MKTTKRIFEDPAAAPPEHNLGIEYRLPEEEQLLQSPHLGENSHLARFKFQHTSRLLSVEIILFYWFSNPRINHLKHLISVNHDKRQSCISFICLSNFADHKLPCKTKSIFWVSKQESLKCWHTNCLVVVTHSSLPSSAAISHASTNKPYK